MLIDKLQRKLMRASALEPFVSKLDAGSDASLAVMGSARPLVIASIFARNPRPMLVVVSGNENAERFARALVSFLGYAHVEVFPERMDMPWDQKKRDLAVIGARVRAIGELAEGWPIVVVASARSLMRKVAPTADAFSPLVLRRDNAVVEGGTGNILEYEELASALVSRGYVRLERVDGPGTFSVAGDTVDIFGAGMRAPVRVEFFGDDVDGLRRVVASTGQSIGELESAEIWPTREFSVTKKGLARLRKSLKAKIATDRDVADAVKQLEDGIAFDGMERFAPALYGELSGPVSHMASNTLVVIAEPRSLFDDCARRFDELKALSRDARISEEDLQTLFAPPSGLDFGSQQRVSLMSMMRVGGVVDAELAIERPSIAGREERLLGTIHELVNDRVTTLFCVSDRHAREDMESVFTDNHVSFVEVLDAGDAALSPKHLNITDIDVPSGFILPDAHLALLSIDDLSRRSTSSRSRKHIDITEVTFPYKPGDYVVHAAHGIALFKGIVRQEVNGSERDYMELDYADDDKLYVPVERIDRVTRYVGPNGDAPRLTRLSTADWTRAITKARKSAKKLAFDLVDLYARRSTAKGFSYSPDTMWQEEMERVFPYEETPDQLRAIADVKADMESEKPMDRLICGDVGFGKTEVAMRAAFKAACDKRQVMVLCPTTILAQQHYDTFSDRFTPFGITVEIVSRFRSNAQQKRALEGFATGTVDVLVGTHRLLSRDVNPKNLGLVIIDEEQRFGVGAKEQLKNLRESVDVLTLSATPIPRTLQMSLSGVRDMSLITTPPQNRRPVKVHVGEWDEDIVSGAIRREMERGGQVYYVSNRVRTIDDAVLRVQAAAPEARIGVAHGQMTSKEIESVMERFAADEIDVLVATTIVESGLDNPHTNTLIIEDSQRLGLAQLYQLKGRVGRSSRQAYAYFLFPPDKPLTEEATDRLQAIGEFTDLGSGMKVAMRDLEIRGAGNLLGAEQSGNMSAVGFDLFASMLAEAVANARGEEGIAHEDIRVDLGEDFFIPEDFMPATDERVAYYRRIAAAQTVEDVEDIVDRMRSSYGSLPEPALNMCDRARMRAMAAEIGVTSISRSGSKIVIEPVSKQVETVVYHNREAKRILDKVRALYVPRGLKYTVPCMRGEPAVEIALDALSAIYGAVEANQ